MYIYAEYALCVPVGNYDTDYSLSLVQPVSYKRYFRRNNYFLLLVYTINLSLRTDLVDPPPMGTFYMKHAILII